MSEDMTPPRDVIPAYLNKWNWGAFFLNWVWGLGNNVYVALLMFIPGINLIMPFVLGRKGNQWAWKNGNWASEADFLRTQKIWSRVGVGFGIGLPVFIVIMLSSAVFMLQNTEPFKVSLERLGRNAEVVAALGEPIELSGWIISGNVSYENDTGAADLTYEVIGPKGEGVIHFAAIFEAENWIVEEFTLTMIPEGRVIDLLQVSNAQKRKAPVIASTET